MSRAVRVFVPNVASLYQCSARGAEDTRPLVGLRPKTLHADAGMRKDPPPSAPIAIGTIPVATATAEPAEDPPGDLVGSHGLSIAPWWADSPTGNCPNSGIFVRPTMTAPASRRRRTTSQSRAAGR